MSAQMTIAHLVLPAMTKLPNGHASTTLSVPLGFEDHLATA